MKMSFSVQTPRLENARNNIEKKYQLILFKAMVKMEGLAKLKAPVDTGNLKNRIHLEPEFLGAREYTLSDGVDYGIHMEFGTKPHYVPIEALKGWAQRVLGDPNAAYAVRAKIAEKGVQAQPFFRPAVDEVRTYWLPKYKKKILGN